MSRTELLAHMASGGQAVGLTITPHSMRRSCATILHDQGTPIKTIQRILRHKDVRTTLSYIQVDSAQMAAAMGVWDSHVEKTAAS